MKYSKYFLLAFLVLGISCSSTVRYSKDNKPYKKSFKAHTDVNVGDVFRGKASFYADKYDGRKTANGEIFRQNKATAAHKKLPFGTVVIVTNLKNSKQVTVRINDRGPFIKGRIIDLSKSAAKDIDMIGSGVVEVKVEIIEFQ